MIIKEIDAKDTYPLRHNVLNPERRINEVSRPGDELATHFGAFVENVLIGIISIYNEDLGGNCSNNHFRIRGMAVEKKEQGNGIGSALVNHAIQHISLQDWKIIWCNSRSNAVPFYEKLGMESFKEFLIKNEVVGHVMRLERG